MLRPEIIEELLPASAALCARILVDFSMTTKSNVLLTSDLVQISFRDRRIGPFLKGLRHSHGHVCVEYTEAAIRTRARIFAQKCFDGTLTYSVFATTDCRAGR